MKLEIQSVNFCIPLTEHQWSKLRKLEDRHENQTETYIFFPHTWKFKDADKIDKYEWNGHFGRNIFFTARDGAEKSLLKFLKRYLK